MAIQKHHTITVYPNFPWVTTTCLHTPIIYSIYTTLSVFFSILTCCCILISNLSTVPVSAALVLSAKGHSGPPSRVHTFSREINGLSLQLMPLSFFVICQHWLGGCLQKVNIHSATYGDWKQINVPLVLIHLWIGGFFLVSVILRHRTEKWNKQVERMELSQTQFLCV